MLVIALAAGGAAVAATCLLQRADGTPLVVTIAAVALIGPDRSPRTTPSPISVAVLGGIVTK